MTGPLDQFGLFVRIKAGENVEHLASPDSSEIPEGRVQNIAYSYRPKPRRTFEQEAQFICGDGLELRQIIILRIFCNSHGHLSQCPDSV
jgi:hypothetical protein